MEQEFYFPLCPVFITSVMKQYLKVKAHGFGEAIVIIFHVLK